MNTIPIILCLLIILDVCVHISTPAHYRLGLPWWRYLPFASFYILYRYTEQGLHPTSTTIEEVPIDERDEISESLKTLVIFIVVACLLVGMIFDRLILTYFP